MTRFILLCPLAFTSLLFSGCASSPEDIAPTQVSDTVYSSLSCSQLGEQELKETDFLSGLENKQHRTHKTDTWGVLMLGFPLSEITGTDVKELLAREKGKVEAIHRAQIQQSCPGIHR